MIRGIIELVLAGVLALPICLSGAQAGNHARPSWQVPDGLDERIRLGRSVIEFAQEFSLFDDQLYGRLAKNNDQRERIGELNKEIKTTSDRLAQTDYALLNGGVGSAGDSPADLPGADQEIRAEVDQLESRLETMRDQLNGLMVRSLFAGENVVLDLARWDELIAFGATRDILESIEKAQESARTTSEADKAGSDDK